MTVSPASQDSFCASEGARAQVRQKAVAIDRADAGQLPQTYK